MARTGEAGGMYYVCVYAVRYRYSICRDVLKGERERVEQGENGFYDIRGMQLE